MKRVHTDKDGYLLTNVIDRDKNIETTCSVDKKPFLGFIHIEHVEDVDPENFDKNS